VSLLRKSQTKDIKREYEGNRATMNPKRQYYYPITTGFTYIDVLKHDSLAA
jgi:hypothetical protein